MFTAPDFLRATQTRAEAPREYPAVRANMEALAREVAILQADLAGARAESEALRTTLQDVLTLVGEPLRATLSQVLAVSESSLARRDRAPQEAAADMAVIQRHAQSMLWRVSGALAGADVTPGGWMPPAPSR
jgi:hypothetical protein